MRKEGNSPQTSAKVIENLVACMRAEGVEVITARQLENIAAGLKVRA